MLFYLQSTPFTIGPPLYENGLKITADEFKDMNKYILRDSGVIIYCKQAVFNDRPRQGNLITLVLFLINILNLY